MKAAVFEQFGAPEVISIQEVPEPNLGQNDVLVETIGVSVNHVDTFVRSGSFKTSLATPHIIGRDLVGRVLTVGPAVTTFKPGDLVWSNSMGYDGRSGVTAQRVAVPVERLYHAPSGVDPLHLVAAVHSAATAAIVLKDVMHASAGQRILIAGAAGHVGTKLVRLASMMGLNVITTANPADFDRLDQLGSSVCLDYHQPLVTTTIPPVDHVIDTSGQLNLQTSLDLLGQNGEVTLITAPAQPEVFGGRAFYTSQKQINGFVISHASLDQLTRAAKWLNVLFEAGLLFDDALKIMPFEQAQQAHQELEAGVDHQKRIVLKFS